MKYKIKENNVKEFFSIVKDLEDRLTERISDLSNVKGGMQSRHAYIYYRSLLYEAKYIIRDNLKEVDNYNLKEDIIDIIDSENSGLSVEQRLNEIKKLVTKTVQK